MFFLLDICFCTHSKELLDYKIFDFRPLLNHFHLATTAQVMQELAGFGLDTYLLQVDIHILDLPESIIDDSPKIPSFLSKLDRADQSLWFAARKNREEGYAVLTDDGELLLECQHSDIPALRLPDFVLLLVKEGMLKKNIAAKCLKFWIERGRFEKKDLTKWKSALQSIR